MAYDYFIVDSVQRTSDPRRALANVDWYDEEPSSSSVMRLDDQFFVDIGDDGVVSDVELEQAIVARQRHLRELDEPLPLSNGMHEYVGVSRAYDERAQRTRATGGAE